jgi:hypothetical protein
MSWQPPTSTFNLLLAGFVGGMAAVSVITRLLPDPNPVYMTGEQSIREWIAHEGLPELRHLNENFIREHAALDPQLGRGQGPSEAFCATKASWLRSSIDLHELIAARDDDIDNGIIKGKRLRTKFEELEHSLIASFQKNLFQYCGLAQP